ncbi:metal-dependent phosphohydrolase [Mycolicibacterium sp. CH28]|uniref:HD domain-containing protein n=1 Tax=Mycolicibacterium sp. CH28 TaxID=2512237 RepID=UPI00108187D8|nr:metal-dependent phosphohydrolase [Mycolicibacterium sp. CH28]TGD89291.1 metal-dependent phosphohydrolase [Mycolicibacterium sp. CH28]
MQDLVEAWAALLARHTDSPEVADVGRDLVASWNEPHRRYHSVEHLRDILSHVEELATFADDEDAVRLAAWYHDAVYGGLPDDEERSARRAEEDLTRLGLHPLLVAEVARLVRLTITHDPAAGDHNGEVLSDADLAALAVPRDRYVQNTAAIRAEYTHVPDEMFRKGRMQVLAALLGGPGVFRTAYARREWEAPAQFNLRAELATLTD